MCIRDSLYAVVSCVANGILYGVPVQLHAHHLLCMVGGGQADGAEDVYKRQAPVPLP